MANKILETKITASLEDYLEAFYEIIQLKQGVKAVDIANRLNVKKSSVTEALKNLSSKGLVNYGKYEVISLTLLHERNTRHQWPLYRGSGNNSFCQTKCSSECGLLPSTNVLANRSPNTRRRVER